MKSFVFLLLLIVASSAFSIEKNCKYEDESSCPAGFYCIHFEKDKDVCVESSSGVKPQVVYPFDKKTLSICDQGNLSPDGNSHTWNNTAFALDLQGDRKKKKNKIYAGVNGIAIIHSGCKTKNDQCGAGFGNHVKILTEDNFIVFYAHLSEIKAKTGDAIKTGDEIGTEGETGWTGKDNRHLHMSVHSDWKTMGLEYWKNLGYLPPSIPFNLVDCNGDVFFSKDIQCKRTSSADSKSFCRKEVK